ncbi:hypothetical protein [Shinella sp. G-2]|uniref:hypothetical protein n=1 Tax=Shinella sp. G-2 TaxID=3133141 RepID=UPI003CFF7FE1
MAATVIPLLALAIVAFVLASAIRAMRAARRTPVQAEDTARSQEEHRRVAEALRDVLNREPLGAPLAGRLWLGLMRQAPGTGVIYEHHRDFCGQGLIRTKTGIMLCDVQDGGASFGAPIAEWTSEGAFTFFFARQSDFSMSGWDANEPVFFTGDDWYRNNQRLTRAVLERFLSRL